MLKQDPVIDYLNEPHEKYALVPIDKAATNMAIICKKYHVTVTLKEMKRMKKLIKIRKKLFKISKNTIHVSNYPMEVKINICQ